VAGRRNRKGEIWSAVARIAERQHGVVSRDQLRSAGLTKAAIEEGIAAGRLYPLFRSTFGVGHSRTDRNSRLTAAILACGEGTVISHGTAAALLGLWQLWPGEIEVVAPVEADVARLAGPKLLADTVEQAAVLRVLNVPEIDGILLESRRRGEKKLNRVLEPWRRYSPRVRVRSRMEAKMLPLLTHQALPIPECNVRLQVDGETFEVDFLWREQRVVVETDGGRYHDNPVAQARDGHRNRVVARAGSRESAGRSSATNPTAPSPRSAASSPRQLLFKLA